jgi:hypothetical protein
MPQPGGRWWPAAVVFLVACLPYVETPWFGFVAHDDPGHVVSNPVVREGLTLRGMAWAFGWATASVGHLNILSVTFTVTMIGVGIDYGTYYVGRYLECRRRGLDCEQALLATSGSVGPGFLGMTWAPFVVESNGNVRNLDMGIDPARLDQRLQMLATIEDRFIGEKRGGSAEEHRKVVEKTVRLMNSTQMEAFKVMKEPKEVQERYGSNGFGRGCLLARRLVESGVPFVEVDLGGWDNHADIFRTLSENKLPMLDQAMSALVADLADRGMLDDTVVMWMGEFGRTPSINGGGGRDHWARSWSVVVGGGGFQRGVVVGETNSDGKEVVSEPYTSQDLMASVLKSLGVSLETTFTAKNGRPMKIANSGKVIKELFTTVS